eukprot:EG_transcript_19443
MSYDVNRRFYPVSMTLLKAHLPGVHDFLFPVWALERCQAVPATATVAGVAVKHPALLPISLLGVAIGLTLGTYLLCARRRAPGGFCLGLAYLLFGLMNTSGTVLHCLFPVDADPASVPHHVAYAADVGFTSTSCASLLLGAAAVGGTVDDRRPGVRLSVLTAYATVLAGVYAVSRSSLHRPMLNLLNEQLYCISIFATYYGLLGFAWYLRRRGRLPRAARRWLRLAVACSYIALPGLLLEKYLCLYLGRHVNLVTCGYAACDLMMAALFPFFLALWGPTATHTAVKRS